MKIAIFLLNAFLLTLLIGCNSEKQAYQPKTDTVGG